MIVALNSMISNYILFYPVLYLLCMVFSASLARKMALVLCVSIGFYLLLSRKKNNIIVLMVVFSLTVLNMIRFGISYIIHLDYYSYILIILIFAYFTDRRNLTKFESLVTNEILSGSMIVLFFTVIIIDTCFFGGLQQSSEWGTMQILYGPYDVPHSLAYQMLLIYAIGSILWHKSGKIRYLLIMAVACILLIWTGVRSAFLAMTFLLIFDFVSIRNRIIKTYLVVIIVFAFFWLLFFTDIITNNPIVQKTLNALSKGSISNHRGDFNNYLAEVFLNSTNMFEKFFGIGMVRLRKTMWARHAIELHAHNDIWNTMLGMGFFGFAAYSFYFVTCCRRSPNGIWAFLVLLILAYSNGLYMYIAFTPCIPVFLVYGKYLNVCVKVEK